MFNSKMMTLVNLGYSLVKMTVFWNFRSTCDYVVTLPLLCTYCHGLVFVMR
jgi:hypothetical protein